MQDVTVAEKALDTEAKLTNGVTAPTAAPTIEASGVLDVSMAQDVYLNLEAADVASMVREGSDLILIDNGGEVLRLQGFYNGTTVRKLFLETNNNELLLADTAGVLADGPVSLAVTPQAVLSPFG